MSAPPCSWCGNPASRVYLGLMSPHGRYTRKRMPLMLPDCYLCPDCDALVQGGKPLPAGVVTVGMVVREEDSGDWPPARCRRAGASIGVRRAPAALRGAAARGEGAGG